MNSHINLLFLASESDEDNEDILSREFESDPSIAEFERLPSRVEYPILIPEPDPELTLEFEFEFELYPPRISPTIPTTTVFFLGGIFGDIFAFGICLPICFLLKKSIGLSIILFTEIFLICV